MFNMYFQFFGLFDVILLTTIYFYKKTYKTVENRIYGFLIVTNLIGQLLHILSYITIYNMEQMPLLNMIVTKLYLFYLTIWVSFFFLYICAVTYNLIKVHHYLDKIKKISMYIVILDIITALFIVFLPIMYYREPAVVYTYGASVNLIYIVSIMYLVLSSALFVKYVNKLKNIGLKKYIPLFAFVLIGTASMFIQYFNPSLLLITSCETFITLVMYATIENPDLKMLQEFHKAREYAETSNAEKSQFLFNMAEQIKAPIQIINRKSKEILMEDNIDAIKEEASQIKYTSMGILDIVDKVLGISDVEKREINIVGNKYNAYNLFKEIIVNNKSKISKDINFRINYDKSIPEKLYGDSVRIKQIVTALLNNSIKHTKEGFIELNINSIIKHDLCRLIIIVEDSGVGMTQEQVEHLFDKEKMYSGKDLESIDDNDVNLGIVKCFLNLIGGTITVNSELGSGSKFTIIIDQKIINDKKTKVIETIEKYEELYTIQNKVLLVVENSELKRKLNNMIKKYPVNIETVTGGQDCLEKIRNNEKFDLIIMEDELSKLSSENTLNKMRSIVGFSTPVILLTNKIRINIKKEYQEKGFKDVFILPIDKNKIKELMYKYVLEEEVE